MYCWGSFNKLKKAISNASVLNILILIKLLIWRLTLVGKQSEQSSLRKGLAFVSRLLNRHEKDYEVIDKELLAMIWGVRHFRPYLYGHKFLIYTDHQPMTHLYNCKEPIARHIRWKLAMDEYDFDVKFKPGKANVVADCLSRYGVGGNNINDEYIEEKMVFMLKNAYEKFVHLKNNSRIINHNVIETRDNINRRIKSIPGVIFTPKKTNFIFFYY